MMKMKALMLTAVATLTGAAPVLAADTSQTYTSGLLVLLFVGFCALLIVAQLVPAVLALFGMTKKAARSSSARKAAVTVRRNH